MISRRLVIGNPCRSSSSLSFLSANTAFVSLHRARNTTPYVPSSMWFSRVYEYTERQPPSAGCSARGGAKAERARDEGIGGDGERVRGLATLAGGEEPAGAGRLEPGGSWSPCCSWAAPSSLAGSPARGSSSKSPVRRNFFARTSRRRISMDRAERPFEGPASFSPSSSIGVAFGPLGNASAMAVDWTDFVVTLMDVLKVVHHLNILIPLKSANLIRTITSTLR